MIEHDKDDEQTVEDTPTDTEATEVPTEQADTETPADERPQDDDAAQNDTFDRAYVEDLRKESAGYRTQLRATQEQLHRLKVEQTGLLADPADLTFDAAHLDDPEALAAAIEALLADKPHLKARRFDPAGAAQGPKANGGGSVNLADLLRGSM